jgi:hypothetical protein
VIDASALLEALLQTGHSAPVAEAIGHAELVAPDLINAFLKCSCPTATNSTTFSLSIPTLFECGEATHLGTGART